MLTWFDAQLDQKICDGTYCGGHMPAAKHVYSRHPNKQTLYAY